MSLTNRKIVVLDDDPTGIQTVHGCLLITQWDDATVREAFEDAEPFFYILTNTRAMTREEAEHVTREAMEAVCRVNKEYGYRLIIISRSDSCLRGHFPLETDVMRQVLEENGIRVWPKTTFCPAFIESGRYTIDGIHYMKDGDKLIPVSETEFARDNVFAYHTSVLSDYIREKGADPEAYDIVNAQTYDELYAYSSRLTDETSDFDGAVVIRSSSSLPKAISGISDIDYVHFDRQQGQGGLFVVGSHVQKTTRQLNQLLTADDVKGIELPIERIISQDAWTLMTEVIAEIKSLLAANITPVVFTARKEVRIDDPVARQHLGQTVSDFLVDIVRNVVREQLPISYLVAKGGITSHDILTHGLDVRIGRVLGQAINSVPCIMATTPAGPLPYIIFPGNVGNDTSLLEIKQNI